VGGRVAPAELSTSAVGQGLQLNKQEYDRLSLSVCGQAQCLRTLYTVAPALGTKVYVPTLPRVTNVQIVSHKRRRKD
jgi:hypothetical protein